MTTEFERTHINIEEIVGSAADTFEQETTLTVTDEARRELIRPGQDDIDNIKEEVLSGRVKISEITGALVKQLYQAGDAAKSADRRHIVAADVTASMKLRCWFRGWC